MHVNVMVREEILRDPQPVRVRPHPGQRRLHRFLHDLANLPGHGESTFAFHGVGLDEQHVAARRSPRQAHGHTRPLCSLGNFAFAANLDATQKFLHHLLGDNQFFALALG